jgi:hypothetical protein
MQEPAMNKPSRAFDLSLFTASAFRQAPEIQVCMPKTAFRIHPDHERTASGIYLSHLDGKWWIVAADVVEEEGIEFPNLWRADLYEGLKRNGQRFVLPVTLPMQINKTDWHDTLTQAARLARKKWITVESDKPRGRFDVTSRQLITEEADDWADDEFANVLEQAFEGRIIYTRNDALAKLKKPPRRENIEDYDD